MSRDSERPTPREPTGSWEAFKTQASALAIRLDLAAHAKRSAVANLRLRDLEGAGRMAERAKLCRWLAEQFSLWPSDPEKWAVERVTLAPLFTGLFRETEEEFLRMPRRSDGGSW